MQPEIEHVPLKDIKITALNARGDDLELDELIASIEAQGVLQPILVRPNGKGYELVAGKRRYLASCEIAKKNGGFAKHKIPVIAREMTDEEAFEIMTVENLQRKNLTPLEEARSFAAHIEKMGEERTEVLAENVGKSIHWVRKRIAALELPDEILGHWDKGELSFAHIEQLVRVNGNEAMFKEAWDLIATMEYSAEKVAKWISENSTGLKSAKFDTTECQACRHNSARQHTLFGVGDDSAKCQNYACFRQKFGEHLTAKWEKSPQRKKYGTTSPTTAQAYDMVRYGVKPDKDCSGCKDHVTGFNMAGTVETGVGCLNRECLQKKYNEAQAKKTAKKSKKSPEASDEIKEKDGPRVAWHGKLHREFFYSKALPEAILKTDPAADNALHLAAFAIFKAHDVNGVASEFIVGKLGESVTWKTGVYDRAPADEVVFDAIKQLNPTDTLELIKRMSCAVVMTWKSYGHDSFDTDTRDAIASHFGVDVKTDFVLNREYLQAKTRTEILALIEAMPEEKGKAIKDYMLKRNPQAKLESKKKPELIELILGAGVDLKGIVPEEIVNYDPKAMVPSKNRDALFNGKPEEE